MDYEILATGSKGNFCILEKHIAIDCGVSFKTVKKVYKDLKLLLLTHIHSDHFNGKTISRLVKERPTIRIGCGKWLVAPLVNCGVPKKNIDVYEIGKIYNYGSFKITPIQLYHDVEQVGYRIFIGDKKAIYMTDTHTVEGIAAKDYDLYMIENNYGEEEIKNRIEEKQKAGQYVYEYRVLKSHLSYEQANDFLLKNMGQKSEYVFLHGHEEKEDETMKFSEEECNNILSKLEKR